MLFDSGRLDLCASVSVLPTAFFLSIYCHLPVSVLLIPPIVPFTHILLSTSLSRCDMVVVECLQFQQPPWPQGCFNSGVHHPVFMTAAPLKERSFLQSQMSWESLSVPFINVCVPTELFMAQVKIHFITKLCSHARLVCLVLAAKLKHLMNARESLPPTTETRENHTDQKKKICMKALFSVRNSFAQ